MSHPVADFSSPDTDALNRLEKTHETCIGRYVLFGVDNCGRGMFQDAGLKLVKKKLPDIDKVNVAKRTTCDLVFENADRAEIDVQIQVFFTDVGHLIVVVADNKDDYKALAKWAKSIQAVDQHDQRDAKVSEDGGDSPSKAE